MQFQFFRHQIQREPPTISSTVRRANENGQMAIGANMRLDVTGGLSGSSANPVILFDRAYWAKIVNFEALAEEGMIDRRDLDLFSFADTPEEIWSQLVERGVLDAHPS